MSERGLGICTSRDLTPPKILIVLNSVTVDHVDTFTLTLNRQSKADQSNKSLEEHNLVCHSKIVPF
jgi:hypothetical protein